MVRYKNLKVVCNCDAVLAQYKKGGSGRLRKMYFERIIEDTSQLLPRMKDQPVGTDIFCLECNKRIGTIALVSGKPALKINQGQVRC